MFQQTSEVKDAMSLNRTPKKILNFSSTDRLLFEFCSITSFLFNGNVNGYFFLELNDPIKLIFSRRCFCSYVTEFSISIPAAKIQAISFCVI